MAETMAEYISREAVVEKITCLCELREIVCTPNDEFLRGLKNALNAVKSNELIPSADVQPVIETENMATVSDKFICKKCGIYLKDYIKVVMDEDNDGYIDEQHYDYEPKYCPECGAKIVEVEV